MGSSEIHNTLEGVTEVLDSLEVDIPMTNAQSSMPLFVVLNEGAELTDNVKKRINGVIRKNCSPRHVPNEIFTVSELPKTLNGKKLEVPIKKILMGTSVEKTVKWGSLVNPDTLQYFIAFKNKMKNNKKSEKKKPVHLGRCSFSFFLTLNDFRF